MLPAVDPKTAAELVEKGALIVDVREPHEVDLVAIPGAVNVPLSDLSGLPETVAGRKVVIFSCKSGGRTTMAANRLMTPVSGTAYQVAGGIEGWRAAGLPVTAGARAGGARPSAAAIGFTVVAIGLAAATLVKGIGL